MTPGFEESAGEWIHVVLGASLQFAAVVVLAFVLDRTLLRGAAPRTRVALWAAVLVPLVVPLRPRVARVDVPWQRTASVEPQAHPAPTSAPVRQPRRSNAAVRPAQEQDERPSKIQTRSAGASRPQVAAAAAQPQTLERRVALQTRPEARPDALPKAPPEPDRPFPWMSSLVLVWGAGVAALLVRALRAELRLRRILTHAPPASERVQKLALEAAELAGLARAPRVVRCDVLASPAVHGTRTTRLLVPGTALALDDDELRAVLVHEAFHVKRHDLVWAPLVALLRALWWFHPLVPFASRALADALEEARDHNALVALGALDASAPSPHSPARLAYARVLVRLAEARAETQASALSPAPAIAPGAIPLTRDGRGLARRVAMIISTPPNHRFTAAGGLVLALGVTGLGLVRAGTDPVPDAGVRAASPGDRVGVERQAPLPDWRVEIDAKLARRLETVVFAKTDLVAALHAAGEMLDIRMRVNDEAIYDSGEPLIDLEVTGASGAELLDLLCLFGSDLYWSIANGTVHVGYGGDLPSSVDLRFYRVAPILESRGLEDPDELISYVQEFGLGEGADHRLQGDFEQQGWSIEMWRGLLAVRATEDGHRSIHTALDRALNAQSLPAPANEPWRAGIEAALAQKLNFQWEDMEASAALMQLSEVIGVPVLHPFEDVDDYGNTFSFNLENVPVQYVLDVVAELQGRRVHIADGAVLLAESYDLETRFYSIEQLLKHADGSERDLVDEVCEFVTGVDSESWDMDPRCVVTRLGDQLVIQQAAKNHEQIAALLAQMERALGGG